MKKLLLFTLILCSGICAQAQYQVTGKVMDQSGESLIGATVREVGDLSNGTITNFDGEYAIHVLSKNAEIEVQYVGYEISRVLVNGKQKLNVVLKTSTELLEEVVVVGYGTQKKMSVTGAITSVNQTLLKQSPTANLSNALVGKMTGLTAMQSSGEPGADASALFIRGRATFTGSISPLVLVDGVERNFNDIDVNEIESVSILKDASATAVYGVRGANGVILVTTKRGEVGAPKITLNYSYGVQSPTRLMEYADSYDYLTMYEEGLLNDGIPSQYTPETIAKYRDRSNPTYKYLYPNVNWTDELLKTTTGQMQANLNVTGGGELFRYFISLGYYNQDGIYKYSELSEYNRNAKMNRYNFRSNIDVNLRKDLKLTVNLGGYVLDKDHPGSSSGTIFHAIRTRRSDEYPMLNPNGTIGEAVGASSSPYAILTESGYSTGKRTSINATVGATWDLSNLLTKGLSVTGRISYDANNYRNIQRIKNGYQSYDFTIAETESDLSKGEYTQIANGTENLGFSKGAGGNFYTLLEALINYERTFGKHSIAGLLMYNQSSNSKDANDAINSLPFRKQGVVGRITYNYAERYYAEFNAGYNGSENFMKGKQMGFFPAVSFSYVLSEEEFLKNISFIDLLKLRVSYGLVGNDDNGSRFIYQSKWQEGLPGYAFGHTGNGIWLGGAGVLATGNENATWEKAKKFNIGIDLGLLKNKVHLVVDLFHEQRSDILCNPGTIPSTVGVSALPTINAGIVNNKGFEVELVHRNSFKDWGYSIRGNFSYVKNEVISADEPKYSDAPWKVRAGRQIGEWYGFIADGFFQSWDEINDPNIPKPHGYQLQPGDIRYKDVKEDGVIDEYDTGFLGKTSYPNKIAGLSLSVNYKGFDVSALFQGSFGGYMGFTGSALWPFQSKCTVSQDVIGNYWSSFNTPEQNENVYYPRLSSMNNDNNFRTSTHWLRSTDYIRFKNLEIGYTLPKSVANLLGLKDLRIYANGLNLFTWDELKVFDPESPNGAINYPQMKVLNFGVNVSF